MLVQRHYIYYVGNVSSSRYVCVLYIYSVLTCLFATSFQLSNTHFVVDSYLVLFQSHLVMGPDPYISFNY